MSLVNDLGFRISDPCPRKYLGGMDCRDRDYRSWRKVLIGLRRSLITARCLTQSTPYHVRVCGWLKSFADIEKLKGHPTAFGVAMVRVMNDPDPVLNYPKMAGLYMDTAARYPGDPSIEFGWSLEGVSANYNAITQEMLVSLKEGMELYEEGIDEGEITRRDQEVDRAVERPAPVPRWLRVGVAGVGIFGFLGLVAWGAAKAAPAYLQYQKAAKGR